MGWQASEWITVFTLQLFHQNLVNHVPTKYFSFHKSSISNKIFFAGKFLSSYSSEDTGAQIPQEQSHFRKGHIALVDFTLVLGGLVISNPSRLRERWMGFEEVEAQSVGALKSRNSTVDLSQGPTGSWLAQGSACWGVVMSAVTSAAW